MAYVYILRMNNGKHYCGISKNVVKRITDHQKGRSKSTRNHRPLVIKFIKEVPTIFHARSMEKIVKNTGVTRWWIRNMHRTDNTAQQYV